MAKGTVATPNDEFMPEYWPANRLIGELENIKVEAEHIIGLIKSGQIEGLEAAKIIGKLTNEQIQEIAAAKISGHLTNSQIESLEVAKLLGQMTTAQIQEHAVTASLLAANSVTAEKILSESITALKIAAGAITSAKIAAGAITAEKLSVEKLSAISANLGTVTAGKLTGVEIETLSKFILHEGTGQANANSIQWINEAEGTKPREVIWAQNNAAAEAEEMRHTLRLVALPSTEGKEASIELTSKSKSFPAAISAKTGELTATLITSAGKSSFLQLPELAKSKITRGVATVKFTAGTTSSTVTVNHGLGETPKVVIATPQLGVMSSADTFNYEATTFQVVAFVQNALSLEATVPWIAIS